MPRPASTWEARGTKSVPSDLSAAADVGCTIHHALGLQKPQNPPMTQRIALQPAYVLSRRPYRESSLLLEAFTRDHGRVGLVARGAQSAKSKLRGILEPLRPLLLSWSERGDLGTLTAAEASEVRWTPLSGEAVYCAWYLNELLLRLVTRHDAHPDLFGHYAETLARLQTPPVEPALRIFEKRLLAELGYGLMLPDDLDPNLHYRYDWDEGPQVASQGYRGDSLMALSNEQLQTPEQWREARHLLREALARHGAGKDLESPKLLRALRASRIPVETVHA